MIARTRHTVVPVAQSDEYMDMVRMIEIPKHVKTDGNRAAWCLRRTEGQTAHFQILTFWDDIPTITGVAGDDYEVYSAGSFHRHRDNEKPIARVWRGVVPIEKGEGYLNYLRNFGFRDYQTHAGNRGAWLLHRTDEARAHFLLLSLWSSREALTAYAGADIEQAHYYPFDLECLVDPVRTVEHYEVMLTMGSASGHRSPEGENTHDAP